MNDTGRPPPTDAMPMLSKKDTAAGGSSPCVEYIMMVDMPVAPPPAISWGKKKRFHART